MSKNTILECYLCPYIILSLIMLSDSSWANVIHATENRLNGSFMVESNSIEIINVEREQFALLQTASRKPVVDKVKDLSAVKHKEPSAVTYKEPSAVKSPKVLTLFADFEANGAVSVDTAGEVRISEYGVFTQGGGNGTRLFTINENGHKAGEIAGLSGPMGSVIDRQGNLFVVNDNDTKRGRILRISAQGQRNEIAEVPGWPAGMTIDAQQNLYVSNYNSPFIHKVDQDGVVSQFAHDARLNGCVGIDFDSKGNLIVGNFYTATLMSVSPDGMVSEIATLPNVVVRGWGLGYLTVVDDVIYTTGIAVNKIFKVDLQGNVKVFAGGGDFGSRDGALMDATFRSPNGIAANKDLKVLYISEYGEGGGIRMIELLDAQDVPGSK